MTENKKEYTNKITAGLISVTEWSNEIENKKGEKIPVKTFQVQKSYKDDYKDDKAEWKTTNSFNLHELPKLISALQRSYDEAVLKSQEE